MDREEYIARRKQLNPNYKPGIGDEGKMKLCGQDVAKRRETLRSSGDELFGQVERHQGEEERVIGVLRQAGPILQKLDDTFEQRTSLSRADVGVLMLATTLQLVRIYMLPKFRERFADNGRLEHNDASIKQMEKNEFRKYKGKHQDKWASVKSKKGYRGWQEIANTTKVPYDATRHAGEGFHDRNMHGSLHRVKTLGHDPILGWVFGVANIITDTITICPEASLGEKRWRLPILESYSVDMDSDFCWRERVPTASVFSHSWESVKEDRHRLYAAIFAQGVHLASDKYTKMGLPVPFLSLIDSDKAYRLYKEGYDYLDYLYDTQLLRRTLSSAALAMTVNLAIGAIHKLFYNPDTDFCPQFYHVRTRKIILYSNLIATSSDVVQTAVRGYSGDGNALKNFDLGGFLVTLHRLMTDTEVIARIKDKFVYSAWSRIIETENNGSTEI